jgi:alkylhydroperoxidase family enzyme
MARLPYPDLEKASPELKESFGKLARPLNIFRMLAHAETCFTPVLRLGNAILARQTLDARLRELALLCAMQIGGGRYEWGQHVPIAEALGASQAQIAALTAGKLDDPSFDAREQTVLRFTRELALGTAASPEALAALRAHCSEREIVELTIMVGYYLMLARVTETLGVEEDPPAGVAIIERLRRK